MSVLCYCNAALLERYSGEDLEKMKAVINALQNPTADDDDLEIESSPPPFYLGFADGAEGIVALSHSTPMLTDVNYNDSVPGTPEPRHIRKGEFTSCFSVLITCLYIHTIHKVSKYELFQL